MKTKGYANHAADKPFLPYEFERRVLGDNDVAIDIAFCGICHSDIHTARSEWGAAHYPCVPGHEIVGTVRKVGRAVNKFREGDRVGVGCMVGSCRTCPPCQEGLEQYCQRGCTGTYNSAIANGDYTKGGYSNYIVVDQYFVLHIPASLDLAAAAPLLCAGITTYSPLRYVGVNAGDKVAILGLGGLGHMGVKMAVSMGAEVTVLSHSAHKKADAHLLGAQHFVLTSNSTEAARVNNHFDVILDTVSAPHNVDQVLGMLKQEGTMIMVGASHKPLSLNVFSLIMKRKKLLGSLIGGIPETQEMLNHCAQHNIVCDIEKITAAQINEAYERVLKSDVKYRFVIDCSSF